MGSIPIVGTRITDLLNVEVTMNALFGLGVLIAGYLAFLYLTRPAKSVVVQTCTVTGTPLNPHHPITKDSVAE